MADLPGTRLGAVGISYRWHPERGGIILSWCDIERHRRIPVKWLLGPSPLEDEIHEEVDTVVLAMMDTALEHTFGRQLALF